MKTPERLFVYGTLRPRLAPAEVAVHVRKLVRIGAASVPGKLYDLGAYPGAVLDPDDDTTIVGEVFQLPVDSETLAALDAYEGFDPDNLTASLFVRRKCEVVLADNRRMECWIYGYNRRVSRSRIIEGGDYRMAVAKAKKNIVSRAPAKTGTKALQSSRDLQQTDVMTDFGEIFSALKTILAKYNPPLTVKGETPTRYHLYSVKDVVVFGRKMKEIYFAGAVIHKNFVSLYFIPVYAHPQSFNDMPDDLMKCLKGKNCFNFKKVDSKLLQQIEKMTMQGFKIYKREKWV